MRTLYAKMALVVVAVAALGALALQLALPLLDRDRGRTMAQATLRNGLGWAARQLSESPPSERPALVERMGRDFGFPVRLMRAEEVAPEFGGEPPREPTVAGRPQDTRAYVPLGGGDYLVAGPLEVAPVGPMRLVGPAALLAIVALLSAFVIASPLTRRLRRLQHAAHALSRGDLQARVEVTSGDVVGQLARDFNTMGDRLAELFAEREQLIQAVSHEISTPLARMRFHLEALQDARDDAARLKRLKALDVELLEIDALSTELASWVDAGGRHLELRPTDVPGLLRSIADYQGAPGTLRQGVTLALDPGTHAAAGAVALADGRQLQRAVDNVVRNALRYARSAVVLTAHRAGEVVEIRVQDDGPGIPVADRTRVFEPFTRLDKSRARGGGTGGGVGLGLAITQRIVTNHQGSVEIEDAPGGGACIIIRVPAIVPT